MATGSSSQPSQPGHAGIPSPSSFGCSLTRVDGRLLLLGGWSPGKDPVVSRSGSALSMMLSLEQDHERRRRLEDEFRAKLERER